MTTTSGARGGHADGGTPTPVVPLVIRGEVITQRLTEFPGRGGSLTFRTPDARAFRDRLPLASPAALADLYRLSFEEILDYLEELGARLDISTNEHLQRARDLTYLTAPRTAPLIDNEFAALRHLFNRERIVERVERTIGLDHLNGWVENTLSNGTVVAVRAFGARALHIIPGNGVGAAAQTIIRSAVTRSDSIIKTPSNNPFVAAAIGQTMCSFAPDHPVTRHIAIAYWRGGDEELERSLYQPHNVSKIVAWGGFASVKHVTRYIQPGLELISLDPKYSAAVVGVESLTSNEELRDAALRIAVDVGTGNQTACSSCRTVYAVTGGDPEGLEKVNRLAGMVYQELLGLPPALSTKPKSYDPELRSNVEAIRLQDDWYAVIGGEDGEGCVIVSQIPDPVDFSALLADRTVNIVPVDSVDEVLSRFDAYTQTVGVYPEALKKDLVDIAPLYGVQRFVSLGYSSDHTGCAPHDGMELERRLCRWVVNQTADPGPLAFAGSPHRVKYPGPTPSTLEAVRSG